MKTSVEKQIANLAKVVKAGFRQMATKSDLKKLATKNDLKSEIAKLGGMTADGFETTATKTELSDLASEVEMLSTTMATKGDLALLRAETQRRFQRLDSTIKAGFNDSARRRMTLEDDIFDLKGWRKKVEAKK